MDQTKVTYADVLMRLKETNRKERIRIVLICNIAMDNILTNCIKYSVLEMLDMEPLICSYDPDMHLEETLVDAVKNSHIVFIGYNYEFILSNADIEAYDSPTKRYYDYLISLLRKECDQPVVVCMPEKNHRFGVKEGWDRLEGLIRSFSAQYSGCYVMELERALLRTGLARYYDDRNWYAYGIPYSVEGCLSIGMEICSIIRSAFEKYKKCIVLDCDNVLWGGILDEVGINGIQLDKQFPGNQYYDLQKYIVELFNSGVIIAICSKNNEQDVLRVMNEHPFMQLKENMLAAKRINWSNKVSNLVEISQEIGIATKDMVFVDDTLLEIELVNKFLPEITAIQFNCKKPYETLRNLRQCGLFKTSNLTSSDLLRNQSYQQEKERKKSRENFENLDNFLQSLDMELYTEEINDFNRTRIAQLSCRSNRANLSCRRYTETELQSIAEENGWYVKCYQLKDKFGDYGYVAGIVISFEDNRACLQDFFLSCRALGRNVEEKILTEALSSFLCGVSSLQINYVPNGRNEDFYKNIKQILYSHGVLT